MPTEKPRVSTVLRPQDYKRLRRVATQHQVTMSWLTKMLVQRGLKEIESGDNEELKTLLALGR